MATTSRTSDYLQADEAWWQAAYAGGQGALLDELGVGIRTVDEASRALAAAAATTDQTSAVIAEGMNPFAEVASRQTASVTGTAQTMEQMRRAIDGVAQGAQEQFAAITRAAALVGKMNVSMAVSVSPCRRTCRCLTGSRMS